MPANQVGEKEADEAPPAPERKRPRREARSSVSTFENGTILEVRARPSGKKRAGRGATTASGAGQAVTVRNLYGLGLAASVVQNRVGSPSARALNGIGEKSKSMASEVLRVVNKRRSSVAKTAGRTAKAMGGQTIEVRGPR